ncbi:SpvB/TcaC N-terminal domain-containing protein [Cytophagaceae bacterium ABcell3]|nr:SpvB/TcaC N-terminal domain-containing protein [Cytophagaceae bacterium ABcell3]
MSENTGVGGNIISVPQGGGAVSGMGEKFSPDLFTGTGNFSVPVALPPGRNGFQPELSLVYSTGNGNGPFGLGWNLSVPGVSRKTSKGVPLYDDKRDVFILSGAEDLIPVPGASEVAQRYRPRTEGLFARIEHHSDSDNNFWKVKSSDGLTSWYGTPGQANSRNSFNDQAVLADPEYRTKVYQWNLTKTEDVFGNAIEYIYERGNGTEGLHAWDMLYLKEIRYGDYMSEEKKQWMVRAVFQYEERPDPLSSYRQGFEVRTTKRCSKIKIYTNPSSGEILTKTYHLTYLDERVEAGDFSKNVLPVNGISLLSRVSIEGHNEDESEWMPPLDFDYTRFTPETREFMPVRGRDLPPFSFANGDYELADLFGSGLPDILQVSGNNGVVRYWRNLGNGKFDLPRNMKDAPAGASLSDPEVSLMDADGDGRVDLVVNKQGQSGYFPMQFNGLWDRKSFKPYKNIPSFSLADPEVQLLDLDGDGVTDVLRNGSRLECFFNHPDEGFYKVKTVEKQRLDKFPNVSFTDPRVRFADMTGDGLQDIVLVHAGHVEYWPNMGHGKWGAKVSMRNSPKLPFQFSPERVLIGDVDGDGMADIVYVENNSLTLWVNKGGKSWSDPVVIKGTPAFYDTASIRQADLNGSGVSGIVWSYDYDGLRRDRMFYFDFTGGVKPYVLSGMDNNMGARTRVSYRSSTDYFVKDFKRPETRWKTPLPFPVQVVASVEVHDELSGGKLVTEYSYHHGYWDGGEREFRGFCKVVQRDTETFDRYNQTDDERSTVHRSYYSPPLETRTWFHPGPVGGERGDWEEPDFSHEYWQEDRQVLQRPADMKAMLRHLPRRAKRDALRTLRGSILRTEVYAMDGSARQNRPYTITENLQGVRIEFSPQPVRLPARGIEREKFLEASNRAGSGYIFFSMALASRTSQWERGNEPMTQYSFTEDYDAYGNPRKQISVALPRGRNITGERLATDNNLDEPDIFYATLSETEFINRDDDFRYLTGRPASARVWEIRNNGSGSVAELRKRILEKSLFLEFKLIGHSVSYYDGQAFTGLPYGELGDYGVPVRGEVLAFESETIADVFGNGLPPYLTEGGEPVWTEECPEGFRNALPPDAGYVFRNPLLPDESHYEEGYYVIEQRQKFDFHVSPAGASGLVLEMQDALGNTASVEYDTYKLMPAKVTDPAGMETLAEYDYRVMQAAQITDPNLNRIQFAFTPLGFLFETAVMGKEGEAAGDTPEVPGTRMEYDFFAFMDRAEPVYVKTIQREHHYHDQVDETIKDNTLVSVEYSDGFGRLLQTRSQAEEVIFGDSLHGDAGLPSVHGDNAPATGVENTSADNPNVIVSGWQVYNNKGWVVEKYEPYYDQGFSYQFPFRAHGRKVKMYYDPRGQVIRTVNPDATEQRVVFGVPLSLDNPRVFTPTPWESYTYDANDLGELYIGSAGSAPAEHHYTPSSAVIDGLGRTVKTIDRLARNGNDVVMRYAFDIRGNLLEVTDALERTTFRHKYDLLNRPLWTAHIDGGEKTVFMDALSRPLELRDAKGALVLNSYDILSRPVKVWARDTAGEPLTLRQKTIYGDSAGLGQPEADNLMGKPYKVYDEAGLTSIDRYDFKGNPPEKTRQVISDATLVSAGTDAPRTDWESLTEAVLDSFAYVTGMKYDALNRVTEMQFPEDVEQERKILLPRYNRSGALEQVGLKNTEASEEQVYVERIAYNARGQRTLIAFGNGMMTRYAYDEDNFRLKRLRTERYEKNGLAYNYASGTVRQDNFYEYDLSGNITSIINRAPGSGVGGTDILEKDYTYDALYRLLSATGRETATTAAEPWDDTYRSHDPTLTRGYTQHYSYDKMGNIQGLQHIATGGNFTRSFTYTENKNILEDITIGQTAYGFIHDVNGNIIREGESRHFAWDYADRLKSFRIQAGEGEPSLNAFYLYDSGGNRIKKLVQKQDGSYKSTTYIDGIFEHTRESISAAAYAIPNLEIGQWTIGVYDQGTAIPDLEIGQWIIGQYGGSTTEQNTLHIMDDQSRIATIRLGDAMGDITPAIKYNLEDHLGSSSIQLDTNGTLVNSEEYYPFGETSFGSYGKKRYRFCGKEKDEESGLYYYGMRYYNAWTCRFVSVDPLAEETINFSPYTYANCNPVMMNDPTGGKAEGTGDGDGDPPANDPQTHSVQEGDTLSGLAEKYGTTVDNLRTLNPQTQKRKQSDQINIGETLSISGESPGSSLPSSEKAKTIQSKAYVIGEKEPVDVDLPTPEALKEGNWEHHRQEWLAKNARSISLFNTKGGTVGLRASQEIFADYAGPMMIQAYAAALFELAFAAPYVLPASRVGRVAPKVKVPAPLPKVAPANAAKEVTNLPKLGIKKFDALDLAKASGDDLFNYAKVFENQFKAGKIGAMTRDQAARFTKLLRQKGIKVRIDAPHSPPNPWQMKHLNVGDKGQIHIPILN